MRTTFARSRDAGHRCPPEVLRPAVGLYFRSPLSLRMVEERRAARGSPVSHATVRPWARQFGRAFANPSRRRLARAGDRWHPDEVALKVAGQTPWRRRAVDQDGLVLDVLVPSRRDKQAAKRRLRQRLTKPMRPPRVMITDQLARYGAATREVMPGLEHRRPKGLNNRAENSHQPPRRRERPMKRFQSAGPAQRCLAAPDRITSLVQLRRDHRTAIEDRAARAQALAAWAEVTGVAVAA